MLLLTGTRKSEYDVRHEHIDWANRNLFIPYTKNGRSRTVYLSDAALSIIDAIPHELAVIRICSAIMIMETDIGTPMGI